MARSKGIFLSLAGALCLATCMLSCGTLHSVESKAFATETDNRAWYTWLAGAEIEIDQTAGLDAYGATIWTDSIPLPDKLAYKAINGTTTQHLTYDGQSQYVNQQILEGKLEYRLRIGPQGNPPLTYAQEIRIRNDIVQTVVAEPFFYSVQNTTFGVPTNSEYGIRAQLTFDYYDTNARVWETYAHEKSQDRRNGDGNFFVTEAGRAEDLLNIMRERGAVVKTSNTNIEVMHIRHIVLTLTRENQDGVRTVFCQLSGDTFTTWNYFGRNNVTLDTYIARIDTYNPYDTYHKWEGQTGLFDFVDTFFTTEIAPDFTIGTLLFLGVGGLLVGLLLKIFLGG